PGAIAMAVEAEAQAASRRDQVREALARASISTFASVRDRNHSRLRHSSRNLPLKLSVAPFCQGLPGSINAVAMPWSTIHFSKARETNSGPLSERKYSGAPRSDTSRDNTSITRPERMRPSTSIARPSFVHSSVTVRHLSCWPLSHQSNTKSYDHTWLAPVGAFGRGRPVAMRFLGRLRGT